MTILLDLLQILVNALSAIDVHWSVNVLKTLIRIKHFIIHFCQIFYDPQKLKVKVLSVVTYHKTIVIPVPDLDGFLTALPP